MKLVISFDMDNAAFEGNGSRENEVHRILHNIANYANANCDDIFEVRIYDINGNYIGDCKVVSNN